ncbi:ATP-dependent Clp protease proteolytic subunit [Janibacter sp. G368]|uniref:ATP-dependent Clp protease proteolytic subunit n=1 Tax=Janibacter sp. G368 TaxID=3420441 RepID=UPI003D00CD6A
MRQGAPVLQRLRDARRAAGRTPEQLRLDTDRTRVLTAAAAKDFGIVDEVMDVR